MAEMNGRMTEISTRSNAPPQQPTKVEQKTEKPDMFADPEGYDRWRDADAERKATAIVEQRFAIFLQQQQQQREQELSNRARESFAKAANGSRSNDFTKAYTAFGLRDQTDPKTQEIVHRIKNSPSPDQALIEWWEETNPPQEQPRQRSQQPRHETRIPESLRTSSQQPPSLNSARGGQRQEVRDPEMLDDSDESTFRFATRP
jgi:hypothetical protein